jgi:ferredoxin-NADP reductase
MRATFVSRGWDNKAQTIGSFYFKPSGRYTFTAGQYADITVPHDNPDSRGITRTMTFSSGPEEKLLRITTRLGPGGLSTYKQALMALRPGDDVSLTDGMGDMVLPLDASVPLLFVAGGVGIASYTGMIQWLLDEKDVRDITLLYSVRDTGDIVFSKLINRYDAFQPLTSILYTPDVNPPYAWKEKVGGPRVTTDDIMKFVKPETQIYLSGTESMVEQLRHGLQSTHKIPQYRIAFDYFSGYTNEM